MIRNIKYCIHFINVFACFIAKRPSGMNEITDWLWLDFNYSESKPLLDYITMYLYTIPLY